MRDSATSFAAFRAHWQPIIENALADFAVPSGAPELLSEVMRYSLLSPGKRIRPLLVLAATDACGGNVQTAVRAACVLEMAHVSSLILDDLPAMDDDDERRGKPTNHKVYGEAQAILASTALLARAFELLDEYSVGGTLCKELASAVGAAGMCGGQSDDVRGEVKTEAELVKMHAGKTGALIRAAVRIGGFLSNVDAERMEALSTYGDAIGLAFQITDDLLDIDESSSGKEKITFPSLVGVERSTQMASKTIDEATRSLDIFGTRAAHLKDFAQSILGRQS